MFDAWDNNGNGYLSLAEIDKGLNDMGPKMEPVYKAKSALMRAFQAAKDHCKGKSTVGDDYVEKKEFRILILYLRQYFEYFLMYKEIDANGDGRLSINEFKQQIPQMEKWGVKIKNPEDEFKKIDVNGGGIVLFDEFSHYCISKSLDFEGFEEDEKTE